MDEKEKEKLKKDIDILFGDDENAAIATLIEYLPEKKSIEELTEEDFINLYAEIMSKIESDDEVYEYLKSKKETNIGMYIDLIKYTKKHIEDIHKAIEERTKLDLKNYEIVELIKSLGPIEIEKYLTPEKVKEFELYSYQITELIKATGNVKEYLLPGQDKKDRSLRLNMANIIYKTGRIEDYLISGKIREYLGEDYHNNIALLIKEIKKPEKIEEYLTPEKVRQLRLFSDEITDLIKATGRDVEEVLQDMIKPYLSSTSIEEKINLPSSMTIGMEIESLGENNNLLKCVINGLTKWSSKRDGSLCPDIPSEEGIEVVSPILTGDNEKTTGKILKICNILNALGNHTNQTCGGHIHIGADYLTNIDAWKNLLDLWANLEETLYTIGNEEGQIPRKGTLRFAGPVSKEYKDAMDDGSISLKDENDIANFKKQIIKAQQDRYRGINFQNLAEGGKNTIEFRLPNGTVNAETWIQNINLFGGLVRTAEELSKIQGKDESDLSEEEKKKLELFESIKNEDLSEEEKFEALLELVIEEQNRRKR